jgi:prepilin-type N-terminal cleavage/methylation domain-containing protein
MSLSKLNKFSKGFTLIELLIVIAIIGVLAASILVALNPAQRVASARNSRVRADLAALGTEAAVFATDSGLAGCTSGYPTGFNFAAVGCTGTAPANYRPSGAPASPGAAYTIAGNAGAITITGPAFADGVNAAGNWVWSSATGQITHP